MPVEDTIWHAEAHTKAKHEILKGYLDAWAPIMSQRSARQGAGRSPLYIDAFAGPGIYKGGVYGSPLIAIKAISEHSRSFPRPIRLAFIEADSDRFATLSRRISRLGLSDPSRLQIERIMNKKCKDGIEELMQEEVKRYGSFGPALVFLDQFGYSQAPMKMIKRIMSGESCEALIYLEYKRMNHTLTDRNKQAALTKAFGSREWEGAAGLEGNDRVTHLRNTYKKALYRSGATFVWDFEMRGNRDELLYWLFFCTSNERGLEEMKKSMRRLDLSGNFRFSDRHVGQLNLLEKYFDTIWLADHLHETFRRKAPTLGEIRKFVLTETPNITFKDALQRLERSSRIRVPNPPKGRRKGTFKLADSSPIEFLVAPTEQNLPF